MIVFLALILMLLPIPTGEQIAAYNSLSGLFWCVDETTCYHEQAHYIDWHNGMPSQSEEYKFALTVYIFAEQDILAKQIVNGMGASMEEVYADLYARTTGNVPTSLKTFYPPVTGTFYSIEVAGGRLYAVCNSDN